jgi:hypothetical protein
MLWYQILAIVVLGGAVGITAGTTVIPKMLFKRREKRDRKRAHLEGRLHYTDYEGLDAYEVQALRQLEGKEPKYMGRWNGPDDGKGLRAPPEVKVTPVVITPVEVRLYPETYYE